LNVKNLLRFDKNEKPQLIQKWKELRTIKKIFIFVVHRMNVMRMW
jgi:hypothetical protein